MDDEDRPTVTVAVLGPFAVTVDGEAVHLPGRLRSLLAALVVSAGRPVTVERLVDVVWGEHLPTSPQGSLQVLVRRLRVALGDSTIETVPGGYRLAVATERVDVASFAALVQAHAGHEPDAERRRIVDALALWRGAPLDGVESAALHTVEAPRLSEQRLTALARRIEIDLAGPDVDLLVGELQELTAEFPLQERFWGQLMTALVRTERRDDALGAYRRLDQRLSDELGIGPGEAIRRLHRDIVVAEDPGDDEPAAWAPRQLPLGTMAFSGREAALAELDAVLADRAGRAGRVAVLDGAGGIGKTATALHWAHRVADQFPDGQLHMNLRGFDPTSAPVPTGTVARTFLEALGVAKGRIPASDDAQLTLYRSIVAGRRMLVVLDNARDAEQVRPLLPGPGQSISVVTSRASLTGLVADEGARRVSLDTLTPSEGFDLLTARVGVERSVAEPEAARQIVDRCAGLPLAIVIAGARVLARPAFPLSTVAVELAEGGGARLDALGDGDATADVRSVFATSYRALSPGASRMFRLLGIHPGPDISQAATVPLLGDPDDVARQAVAELVRVNLVTEHAPGRYAMHDLVAEYARECAQEDETAEGREAAIRRTTTWYVDAALTMTNLLQPNRIRPPFVRAPTSSPEPGDDPAVWFHAEWTNLLAVAGVTNSPGSVADALSLVWAMMGHYRLFGEPLHDWQAALTAVRETSVRASDGDAELWCTIELAGVAGAIGNVAEAEALHERAVALSAGSDDLGMQTMAHSGYAEALVIWGRSDEAVPHAEAALRHGRATGSRHAEANMLNTLAWCLSHRGDLGRALRHAEQAVATLEELGNPGVSSAWDTLGFVHTELGNHDRAIECYREAVEHERALNLRRHRASSLRSLPPLLAQVGRWDEARDTWQECLDLHIDLGLPGVAEIREELARAAGMAEDRPHIS